MAWMTRYEFLKDVVESDPRPAPEGHGPAIPNGDGPPRPKGKVRCPACGFSYNTRLTLDDGVCICRECGHRWNDFPRNSGSAEGYTRQHQAYRATLKRAEQVYLERNRERGETPMDALDFAVEIRVKANRIIQAIKEDKPVNLEEFLDIGNYGMYGAMGDEW